MTSLQFKIDPHQLAYYVHLKHTEDETLFPEWATLVKSLESQFESTGAYLFFQPKYIGYGLNWIDFPHRTTSQFVRDEKNIVRIFANIFESEIFKNILSETEAYKTTVESDWTIGGMRAQTELEKITGQHNNDILTVYILHPKLGMGSYLGDQNIEWGNKEIYKGYHVVGLAHESLHHMTADIADSLLNEEDHFKLHALIHLATDQELRVRLYPESGEYFNSALLTDYHGRLVDTAKKLLPEWKEYCANEHKNLLEFFEKIR